jgi:hypothetical protein
MDEQLLNTEYDRSTTGQAMYVMRGVPFVSVTAVETPAG